MVNEEDISGCELLPGALAYVCQLNAHKLLQLDC